MLTYDDRDLFTVREFKEMVAVGMITDDDGIGYFSKLGKKCSNIEARPSEVCKKPAPYGYKYVAWFKN